MHGASFWLPGYCKGSFWREQSYGGGPFVRGPEGRRADKRVSDDRVSDERVTNVLGKFHGHIMAMTVFMAMAMTLPCYGHDHAMFAVINMVIALAWQVHGHVIVEENVMAKTMILEKIRAKGL